MPRYIFIDSTTGRYAGDTQEFAPGESFEGPVDAAQALSLGIANRVVPDAELADATMAFARKLAQGPRIALGMMKQNFNAAENGTLAALLDLEALRQIETGKTEDHKEAARAFVEKRAPVFVGR